MPSNPLHGASFALSTPEPLQLPADSGAEIAFAGRSNAGKSSALNVLVGVHGLARTSRTPGRTQHLVAFVLPDGRRLVDLPGYGYAKVPEAVRAQWRDALEGYLMRRRSLRALALVMDIRHPLTPFDQQMLAFCAAHALPCHVLLTKADKLGRGQTAQTLLAVQRELAQLHGVLSVQVFSATAGTGVEAARGVLTRLLGGPPRAIIT
ncbi:ribosome biogenesis GTP-binding protein YihA/YsxC [Metallibacterium scheffleri]|uniref:Probable GTP-binding protein EngB n=1 Tax=Metallibacterium scheffleri TaxID=993689 RepID=A0A4S3KPJ5_9GAMM|nr:ribosome biogenesis GTP-binding protein YihA/YsxC [Metallibacterium scheffleri]THD10879.1 YihA family ribosome biogenesis GTP-binding protein [Metallibacterium scheffleri]